MTLRWRCIFLPLVVLFVLCLSLDPKVVILTMYNGEHIMKLHLDSLLDFVDLFVVVESESTISGRRRDKYFSDVYSSTFEQVDNANKLVKLKVTSYPFSQRLHNSQNNWKREKYQRDFGVPHIISIMKENPFLLILADADEMCNKTAIIEAKSRYNELSTSPLFFSMKNYIYSFKFVKAEATVATFAINDVFLRNHPNISLHEIRKTKGNNNQPVITYGGWHCTKFMTAEKILEKLDSSAHSLDSIVNRPEIKNITWIRHAMNNGIDVLNRTYEWEKLYKCNGEYGYPECITCKQLIDKHFLGKQHHENETSKEQN